MFLFCADIVERILLLLTYLITMCKDKTFPFITKFELPLCRSNIELKCTLTDYFTLKIIPSSMCTLVFSFSSVNSIHLCEHHKNYQKKYPYD